MQKERMGFPRKEITIVTKIYIYIYIDRQQRREREKKKRRNEMCLY